MVTEGETLTVKIRGYNERCQNHHSQTINVQNSTYQFKSNMLIRLISPLSIIVSICTGFIAYYIIIHFHEFNDVFWMRVLIWTLTIALLIFISISIGCLYDLYPAH